jgi:hypothetical protein
MKKPDFYYSETEWDRLGCGPLPDERNILKAKNMPNQVTNEEYVAVLETEKEILLRDYYRPKEEGTGHFNTTASVLQHRIDEIKKKMDQSSK